MTTTERAICKICGDGHLAPRIKRNIVEYKGTRGELDAVYSVCDSCGSEQAASDQLRTNKRAMIKFRKVVDGLLIGNEVRAIREKLKLSQAVAALIFGGGPVAFSKYESDDVAQSEAMDKLIRLAAELPTAFEYLARQAGIEKAISMTQWETVQGLKPASTSQHRPKLKVIEHKVNDQVASYAA